VEQESDESPIHALKGHWRIVVATTLGWSLDAFDQMILIFLLTTLRGEFNATLPMMGLLLSVTYWSKIGGNVLFGWMSDRWGRKIPFMVSILWFAVFSGLTGLAWSYGSLLVFRFLFAIGYGGEWSAGAALLMESVPARGRALASSIMMAGFEVGYFCAALAFAYLYPLTGWRFVFFIGVIPALLVLFVRRNVAESPVWLASRNAPTATRDKYGLPNLTAPAIQGWLFLLVLQFQNTAIFALYPTFLLTVRHLTPMQVFPYATAYAIASVAGKPLIGYLAARLGQRPVIVTYLLLTVPTVYFFTIWNNPGGMFLGSIMMGFIANSIFGLVPAFLARRYESTHRSIGMGIGQGFGALGGSLSSWLVTLCAVDWGLDISMAMFIAAASLTAACIAAYEPDEFPEQLSTSIGMALK
jgi:MFS transporter, SHS family, lactate transporter